ncbi:PTB-containing, cubilin and LRP1-interacting protein-like [Babylonia areolata]|uniref:PTB-containing, cubilin and LRP1-interacting protein-like n=1 Tax=Babylonia areolata TaxID=304850 RepID=UPI003FD303A7
MFGRRKDGAKISDRTPVFHVRYVGCTVTHVATGTGCSRTPVQRLWDNSPAEKHMPKVAVHISPMGLTLTHLGDKQTHPAPHPHPHPHAQTRQFDIENISFCTVERAVSERLFSWIYRVEGSNTLHCHAVLCSTDLKAHTMAIVLSRAFQIAYRDWRAHHRHHDAPTSRLPTTPTPPPPPASRVTSSPSSSEADKKEAGEPSTAATLPAGRKEISCTSRPPEAPSSPVKHAHFSDDVALTVTPAGDGRAASHDARASVHVQQLVTSSCFVSSSIWDPEMDDVVGDADSLRALHSLHADLDLDDP